MRVFISGINGNMGRRYSLICKMLGHKVSGSDNQVSFSQQTEYCRKKGIERVIIATPTHSHLDAINIFANSIHVPMLVEKPICRNLLDIQSKFPVTMINQYKYLVDKDLIGQTHYNFYKTGSDGLYWDCINIIGMAKTSVKIKNDSPIWTCTINGKKLSLADMDQAYVDMIDDWVKNPVPDLDYQVHAHKKVYEMVKGINDYKNVVGMKTEVIPILGKAKD